MSSDSPLTNKLSLQEKVAFYLEDTRTIVGLWFSLIILGLILLSSAIFVAETYPISDRLRNIIEICDRLILIIFTIEYCLRFWSAPNKTKFFLSFFSFIDLLAISPLLFGFINISFIRVFRWFRILRIIRFWQFETELFGIKAQDSIVFARIFLTLFSIIFVYAGLIYQVEHQVNDRGLENFFDAFYFVVVTMTTVGYGDVTPLSEAGRAMTVLMIFTGVLFIPWQLSELIGLVVKTATSVEEKCHNCGLSRHEPDAIFCKQCGTKLDTEENEG
ncbi:ion transporter [Myxosarcina sp. GI1]|uniref:ion transporter n=1 Tax=Myxosarcina sp. GI1 TaxID=1541065 RepID=UPI000560C71A|nr:ion transporter [Myxosarcina sp. GI1]